jgi:hypothetical protein
MTREEIDDGGTTAEYAVVCWGDGMTDKLLSRLFRVETLFVKVY